MNDDCIKGERIILFSQKEVCNIILPHPVHSALKQCKSLQPVPSSTLFISVSADTHRRINVLTVEFRGKRVPLALHIKYSSPIKKFNCVT